MEIYKTNGEDIGADGEIALAVNGIEKLSVMEPDEKKLSDLIERLKALSEHFPENVIRYIDEIRGITEFTIKYYKERGFETTPDISFLDKYGK